MRGHRVTALFLHVPDHPLEALVREGLDLPAVVAHDVVVVMLDLSNGLEAHHAVAEVEPLHEPSLGEHVQHPVDACQADPVALRVELAVDVLCTPAALLPLEELDHPAQGKAAPVPRCS